MLGNENRFLDGLTNLLQNTEITLYDGTVEFISDNIYMPQLPDIVAGNTQIVLVPMGPQFDTSVLGSASMNNRTKRIAIMLMILHDGIDETSVVRNLSELTHVISEKIMTNIAARIGGADFVHIVDVDYDWFRSEDQDANTLKVMSSSSILLIAEYGRNK